MAEKRPQIDNRIDIVTPENIAFSYRVAGPFQRLPAYLLDLLIRGALVVLIGIPLTCAGFIVFGPAPIAIVAFVLEWFYGGIFEALWNGQTPGKRLLRIRVLSTSGEPINGMQAVLRNVLRAADMLPSFITPTFQVGLLTMSLNDRYQRLGDLVCDTMVVVEEPQPLLGVARVSEPQALALAEDIPRGFVVSRSLALALSNYVQRRHGFPWPRRAEIARHLGEPLRVKFGLPQGTSYDMLLCALYHRVFIDDRPGTEEGGASPFSQQQVEVFA